MALMYSWYLRDECKNKHVITGNFIVDSSIIFCLPLGTIIVAVWMQQNIERQVLEQAMTVHQCRRKSSFEYIKVFTNDAQGPKSDEFNSLLPCAKKCEVISAEADENRRRKVEVALNNECS
ncbi:predicted protein [Sclerotinia sclerotiorum 1980 UF-70]|uniref:Uncharacterized protein n=1 Tax=Sclerotinia sclerotiorum (strain ATCC 18683 / 1980 / Ss-1) TaxID=665079 RepID=A7EGF6_SCLS1|nr:predicted protein [Sclerotinia sclerotiorum 1980 UF-70]EDO01922.1 predicted protein [Sclerotinia sclerotiorum 1980 UF-70]